MNHKPDHEYTLERRELIRSFDRAANQYDKHAVFQQTVAMEMVDRLTIFNIKPSMVLDAGSGTGFGARQLRKQYPSTRIVMVDIAQGMLRESKRYLPRFFVKDYPICADIHVLPLASQSVDMIFSSLALQWCNDLDRVFAEFKRVLKINGLLMFATLGPDTLKELRSAWRSVDDKPHVHAFMDMHDVGDALIRAQFAGPVLDVMQYQLTYPDVGAVMRDLKNLGTHNSTAGRGRGLLGKRSLAKVVGAYEKYRSNGQIPATYEVVYAHAWNPVITERPQDGSTVTTFPLSRLKRVTS